ncbi:proteasome subunit beta [Nonomuraea glycinis]|uniref:Proteasome subunit beta n=1 Tax=Nonomuraea glycinis TaxID=2047744 RepID=A0A918A988_9ACTN|nr:proteasome subunit beta [Nonomuraea glycinis]WSG66513.1 proteasome subunit beta [Nonomuraea glycinis]GGP09133.1 proteasome subunit beta [Nonomuraea glycinis]
MASHRDLPAGLRDQLFHNTGSSSFTDFVGSYAPELLPLRNEVLATPIGDQVPHATTIIAATFAGGVVMAGDRRATSGNIISQRDVEKVFRTDDYSCMGIAGTASTGIEMARLYRVELEHYEKLEGRTMSVAGKANRLATMIRGNLAMAMQGLVVVPLFAAYDPAADAGRIFSYDVAGGPYERERFDAIGSGSIFARGSLKKLYRDGASADDMAMTLIQALYDAADDDSATGGPDVTRKIWPIVSVVDADGFRRLSEEQVTGYVERMLEARLISPDGPIAPLR